MADTSEDQVLVAVQAQLAPKDARQLTNLRGPLNDLLARTIRASDATESPLLRLPSELIVEIGKMVLTGEIIE